MKGFEQLRAGTACATLVLAVLVVTVDLGPVRSSAARWRGVPAQASEHSVGMPEALVGVCGAGRPSRAY